MESAGKNIKNKKANKKQQKDTDKTNSTANLALKIIVIIFLLAAIPFVLFNPNISLGPFDFLRTGIFRQEIVLKGYKVSPNGFVKAIQADDKQLINLYILSGLDLNRVDSEGISPLCYAASLDRTYVVKALLKENVSVLTPNTSDGLPPVFCAVQGNDDKILESFVEKGIDLNARSESSNGMSPLHYAAMLGKERAVAYLIKAGVNINLYDFDGRTPLHYAAEQKNIVILHMLLNAGADPNLKDSQGNTPLDIAIQLDNTQFINLLKNCAALVGTPSSKPE